MAKRKAEFISKDELTNATARCEASPTTVATNCRDEGHGGKTTGKEADTRRVSGSETFIQSETGVRVPLEVLPTGPHVAIAETTASVHKRPALEPPVTPTEDEEVSKLEEALEAFWSLLLEAGYEPC